MSKTKPNFFLTIELIFINIIFLYEIFGNEQTE